MNFNRTEWRIIRHPPSSGAWNMAADEAILLAIGQGEVMPTLRLYGWYPPCLSLGYAQSIEDVNIEALKDLRWDLVRRPTGGRAILHTDELTYSVVGPETDERLMGGVLESYNNLSRALLLALHLLEIPAQAVEFDPSSKEQKSKNQQKKEKNPVCFEVPSSYEITLFGKKLIGSAQARRKEGVMQHGSLPLFGDLTRIIQGLNFKDEASRQHAAERLNHRATTIAGATGMMIEWERAADAVEQGFREALNLELIPGLLTEKEQVCAQELITTKYSNMGWTARI